MRTLLKIQFLVLLVGFIFTSGLWVSDFITWLKAGSSDVACNISNSNCSEFANNPFISIEFFTLTLFLIALLLNILMFISAIKRKEKVKDLGAQSESEMLRPEGIFLERFK